MNEQFPIIDVTEWPAIGDEMLGRKPKCWLTSCDSADGVRWLFKQKSRSNSEDDWSEKIASELAERFGIPHATVELATRSGERGIISRNLVSLSGEEELILGNSLLVESDPNYPTGDYYHVAQHTVDRILTVLQKRSVGLPPGASFGPEVTNGIDLFIGYLLFDAWIGNTDRHHENWAGLKLAGERYVLAPSYDHAASLGHNLLDADRHERLITKDKNRTITQYAAKARSAFYRSENDKKAISTDDAFLLAATASERAAAYWLSRLRSVNDDDATGILRRVPRAIMSESASRFADQMVRANRARLSALTL